MWTTPSVVSILARWLPSRMSSTISGWRPSASPTGLAWSWVGRDRGPPRRPLRLARAARAGPARAAVADRSRGADRTCRAERRRVVPGPRRPARCARRLEGVARRDRRPRRRRPGSRRSRPSASGSLRHRPSRLRSAVAPAVRGPLGVSLRARPPSARPGGIATAVTTPATRNSPTRIPAASRDAHASSASTTSASRSGRSRSSSGMNSCSASGVA